VRLARALRSGANRRLHALHLGHVHDVNRRNWGWRTLAHLLDGGWRKRAAGILGQRGLLARECHRWRRRSGARDNRPAESGGRRARSAG
jgi:hypothetical protein